MFGESYIGQWTIHEWALSLQTISKEPVGGPQGKYFADTELYNTIHDHSFLNPR